VRVGSCPYTRAVPTIRIPEALRRYAGGEAAFAVAGATVGEALEEAFRTHPDLRLRLVDDAGLVHPHLAIFRNEEQLPRPEAAGWALQPEDTLIFLVAVGGG